MPEPLPYSADVAELARRSGAARDRASENEPAGYLPDPGLVDAVNAALLLGKPLLVTGDPGTGKTQLARSVAWQLALTKALHVTSENVEKFETKSTSVARDLFYSFDAIGRFQMAQDSKRADGSPLSLNADFITFNALGRAVIRAMPPSVVPPVLKVNEPLASETRSVVLIDEIDKAPRDFPNDLLNEIEGMYFRIPELQNLHIGGDAMISPDLRPIVIITSNSEKNLPDPFLRRCVYYHIPFPLEDRLRDILLSRLAGFQATNGPLVRDGLTFFEGLRKRDAATRKRSPAQLIDWLTYMMRRGANPKEPLRAAKAHAFAGLGTITKDQSDQDSTRKELESFIGAP